MEEKVVIFFLIIPIDNATFPESASCRWPAYLTMQQLASKKKRKEKILLQMSVSHILHNPWYV